MSAETVTIITTVAMLPARITNRPFTIAAPSFPSSLASGSIGCFRFEQPRCQSRRLSSCIPQQAGKGQILQGFSDFTRFEDDVENWSNSCAAIRFDRYAHHFG